MTCRKTILFLSILLQSLTIFAQRTAVVVAPGFDVTNPANRVKYEQYIESHPFSKRKHYSKQELKAIPKQDRPDLAWEQDFLRTLDPVLGRPAPERLIEAYNAVEQFQANQMGIPGSSAIPWIERGPNNVGGRTRAIVFDPNDTANKKVWAGGVTGGLWYNTDITNASSQWIAVNDFWDNLAVTAIAFDPNDSQTIYVGTGEGFGAGSSRGAGVWKSTNGGSSFSQLSATDSYYYVNDLVVRNESGSSVLYVGVSQMYYQGTWQGFTNTSQGMFRSTNGGVTFTQVMPTTGTTNSYYAPADIEIAANNRIWIGTRANSFGNGGGVVMYSDNGTTWTVATDRGTNRRVEIACAPSNSNVVYAIVEASSQVDEIIKTTDAGTTWTSSSSSSAITEPADADTGIPNTDFTRSQAWYDLVCAVDPTDANVLYVGGIDLFRSTNAGLTWTQISKWSNNNNLSGLSCPLVHADQHAFVFRPGNNNQAVIGNDGGVYYASSLSTAASSSSAISHNVSYYNVTQYYACAISPTASSNVFLAGAQDNGTQRYTAVGINATSQVFGGDGAYCFIDQTNATQAICSYVYNSYYFSSNSGNSFGTSLLADQNTGSFINPADYDDNQNILYSCKDANSIYRISGIGSSPSTATVTISGMTAKASNIKVSPFTTTSSKLYIGTTGGNLFKVTSANSSTSPTATNITGSSFPVASISSIEFGASENEIVVTFFNYGVTSVWYTANGGTTWASKEGNLPDMPVRWCLMNPTANNEVILATEVGVWSTNNFQSASPTWIPSNSGLANVRVDMLQMRASDSEVIAATHGRGLFSSSYLSSVCTYPTSLSGTNIGATSADISWVAGSTETAWNIEYGLSGFSQGTGTSASVTTNSYTVSGLSTGFSYDFYVQADCGSGTTSVWAGPYTFSTVCGPITSFPYTMDFESGSPCWSVINGGDANTWTLNTGTGIGGGFSANITYSATAHDDHLISPQFTVTNGVSNRFSFWAKNQSTSYPEDFDVYVSTTGNSAANFTNIIAQNVFPTTGTFTNYSYDLSAFNGQTVYVSIYSNTTDQWLLYIDDVVIDAPCLLNTSIPVTACNSYTWSNTGLTYTSSGSYTDSNISVGGCDSVVTLNLTINNSNSGSEAITACNTYTWAANSQTYTASGAYSATLTNAAGCDSVATLNLTINSSLSSSETIAACATYTWAANSITYTSSGIYTTTLTSVGGCDSVVTLNLTINFSNSGSEAITACNTYTWAANSQTYTASGAYTATLTNAAGCDSVATLNLTINSSLSSSETIDACGTYTWAANSQTYTSSGIYTTTLTSAGGCDSVVTLNLTINNSNSGSEAITACNTYTWAANSQTYTASGAYTATLTNAAGCDSVATLNLTINSSLSSSETIAACATYTWPANSQTYTSSGAYSTTLTSAGGCDSVVTLNLTINNSNSGSVAITACNTYTWAANSQTYTASGTYSATLTNVAGCDSIATLNLTINSSLSSSETIAACATYTWPANSQTYTSSGAYSTTLTSAGGCDSVVTLNLTIGQASATIDTVSASGSYTWAANGITYSASGTYLDTLTSIAGCDSVVTLQLTIVTSLVLTTTASDTVVCAGTTVNIGVTTNAAADSSGSAFIMKVLTTNPGTSNNDQFQLTGAEGEYNIVATHIASGNIETFNNLTGQQTLTFSNGAGDYLVKVFPTGSIPFNVIRFGNTGDRLKLIDIANWGSIEWSQDLTGAFYGCDSMDIIATDVPNFLGVSFMNAMFANCSSLTGNSSMNNWDLNSVSHFSQMFSNAISFNQNISNWEFSSVQVLSGMFEGATSFNQDIGNWDVSSVYDFDFMFFGATSFNQYIGNWNISSASSMTAMFSGATSFNQDIGSWLFNSVNNIEISEMFRDATSFNQDIGSWDLSLIMGTDNMFNGATSFNQDIGSWDVSDVTSMELMFNNATSFNQDISGWCVTNIDSLPTDFSTNSPLTIANHPMWGTCPDSAFVMKVRTTNPGTSNNNQFQLTGAEGEYNIVATHIASGNTENFNNLNGAQTLTFSNGAGDYLVKVFPTGSIPFNVIRFGNTGDRLKLIDIANWGSIEWSQDLTGAFYGCDSMDIIATDVPNFLGVSFMNAMFANCSSLTGNSSMNNWDLNSVSHFSQMFSNAISFNQNISNWEFSSVQVLSGMFEGATSFNQDIGNWDVSSVYDFDFMFFGATSFNQYIGNWNISSASSMTAMFSGATSFNQDIGSWLFNSVNNIEISEMFRDATSFNQDIGSWDLSLIMGTDNMFNGATSFNQDIGSWDVSNVVSMSSMFEGATSFNQDIGGWDVSSVQAMDNMFFGTVSFNQDLTQWCVSIFGSQPINFSNSSALTPANQPVWGTCP
jgi:surface protein